MLRYLKDTFAQVIKGLHKQRREEIIRNLSALPEGRALLQLAEEKKLSIRVVGELGPYQGLFGKWGKSDETAVYVLNTGNPVKMTLTLAHELRHARQFSEMEVADPLAPLSSAHIRSLHIQKLMIEADAFTTEAMLAFQFLKVGQTAYMKEILKSESQPYTTIQDFLSAQSYKKSTDETAYRRALFTEIMLKGLAHYNSSYFSNLAAAMEKSNLGDLHTEHEEAACRVTRYPLPLGIAGSYGADFTTETSVRALSAGFLQALPLPERKTLRLVEQVTGRAKTITEKEFLIMRDEITRRCREHGMDEDRDSVLFASRKRTQAEQRLRRHVSPE